MSRCVRSLLVFLSLSCGSLYALPVWEDGNVWERSGKFQGDIVFRDSVGPRNGLVDPVFYWPDRTLVYKLDDGLDGAQREMIQAAFDDYSANTCVRMREATSSDQDYVYIQNTESGCWSSVGRIGGRQTMNLGNGCFYHGVILHELLHNLGFYHQQSATNRDDYVTIIWSNIQPGHEEEFEKLPASLITDFGVEYDYGSIMHFSASAFSTSGRPTIVTKDPNAEIGQRRTLSDKDIAKLELMYGCRK